MAADQSPGAPPDPAAVARTALRGVIGLRAAGLAFSVPYMVVLTRGLGGAERVGLVLAHACALLAIRAWNDLADGDHARLSRLAVTGSHSPVERRFARRAAAILTPVAVLAALLTLGVHALLPLAAVLAILLAWALTRLPLTSKYLLVPEVAAPVLLLVLPAAALTRLAGVPLELPVLLSGVGCLVAFVLACHLRDRPRDLADDVPTLATRRPRRARTWCWIAGLAGGVTAVAPLTHPLDPGEVLRVAAAIGVICALALHRGERLALGRAQVPALAAAHGALGVSWLLTG